MLNWRKNWKQKEHREARSTILTFLLFMLSHYFVYRAELSVTCDVHIYDDVMTIAYCCVAVHPLTVLFIYYLHRVPDKKGPL